MVQVTAMAAEMVQGREGLFSAAAAVPEACTYIKATTRHTMSDEC